MLEENEDKICKALKQDLNKPAFESALTEVVLIKKDILECKRSLKSWMKPERKSRDLATSMSILETRRDSLGVCLVISAFNYPLALQGGFVENSYFLVKQGYLSPFWAKFCRF